MGNISRIQVSRLWQTQSEDQLFWDDVFNKVNQSELIKQYYSLLPMKSYHMTTMNLFTNDEQRIVWDMLFANLDWFQKLHEANQLQKFYPHSTITGHHASTVIILLLEVDPDSKEEIFSVAEKFSLQNKVPPVFHVTLAYAFKAAPVHDLKLINTELKSIIQGSIKSHPSPLQFEKAKLTYFDDMTEFLEWDGKTNTFRIANFC